MAPLDQILDGTVPENAVVDTLKKWLPTYLAHIARAKGLDPLKIQRPRSWAKVNEDLDLDDRFPEEAVPAIYAVSTGVTDIDTEGDGWVRATWAVAAVAVVSARDSGEADDLGKLYGAAIRGAIMQNRSLGSKALGTTWRGESYNVAPSRLRRSLGGANLVFEVQVDRVVNVFEGIDAPLVPPPDIPAEPPPWPTVDEDKATVTIERSEDE